MTLNKLPNGSDAPRYECKAKSIHDEDDVRTLILTEWWNEGKLIESIEQSAESYFYDVFDKESFEIITISIIED